ncbi:MAG: peptidylprolyl isomerase [Planctomycetota bacterium]
MLSSCVGPNLGDRDSDDAQPDATVAIVGDTVITRAALKARILERHYGRRALLGVIREELFVREAAALGVSVTSAELDAAVADELRPFLEGDAADRENFLAELGGKGMTLEDVQQSLRPELRNRLLIERVVLGNREVSELQVQSYYEQTFQQPRVRLRHIAFPFEQIGTPSAECIEATRTLALQVRARIEAGEDFAALAREHSGMPDTAERGGELGWVSAQHLTDPKLAEAVFGLAVGTVSAPIQDGEYGFQLFEVMEAQPQRPLAEVREQLLDELKRMPPTPEEVTEIEQLLRDRCSVTVFDENL